jgi:hypothetical protein
MIVVLHQLVIIIIKDKVDEQVTADRGHRESGLGWGLRKGIATNIDHCSRMRHQHWLARNTVLICITRRHVT